MFSKLNELNRQVVEALKLREGINQSTLPARNPLKQTLGSGKKLDSKLTKKKGTKIQKISQSIASPPKTSKTKSPSLGSRSKSPNRDLRGSHTEDYRISPILKKCEEHPDEDVQFYSFINNRALCSTCLLTGPYVGSETLSIKKASDILRHKIADLVIEMQGKLDIYELFIKKLGNRKEELKNTSNRFKNEISNNIQHLVRKLQSKERELVEEIEKIEKEKLKELNQAEEKLTEQENKVQIKRKELEGCVKKLSGLDLCTYYSKQTKSIEECLLDELIPSLEDAKYQAETNISLQERVNTEELKNDIRDIATRIESFKVIESFPQRHSPHHHHHQVEMDRPTHYRSSPLKRSTASPNRRVKFSRDMSREISPTRARLTMIEKHHPISVTGATSLYSPKPDLESTLSRSRSIKGLKQMSLDEIILNGYYQIQEVKAKTPGYKQSPLKKKEGSLGMSSVLSNMSNSKRPLAALESRLVSPQSDASLTRSFMSVQRLSNTGKENFKSRHESPQRDFDLIRSSIRNKLLSK